MSPNKAVRTRDEADANKDHIMGLIVKGDGKMSLHVAKRFMETRNYKRNAYMAAFRHWGLEVVGNKLQLPDAESKAITIVDQDDLEGNTEDGAITADEITYRRDNLVFRVASSKGGKLFLRITAAVVVVAVFLQVVIPAFAK